jgi:hypothetical protein
MATSATLKMPVRTGPIPMFTKSITPPIAMRSVRLDNPPAKNSTNPHRATRDQR